MDSFSSNKTLIKENTRDFIFGYLENDSLGGSAFAYENTDYIYLNCGSILKIHDLFLKLLSNPQVFPKIGNFKYSDFTYHKEPIYNNGEEQMVFYNGSSDKTRNDLALQLAYFAVLYIILHEIGHHFNGHVLLLSSNNLSFSMEMTGEQSNIDNLERQTLEMDADSFATSNALGFVKNFMENPESLYFSDHSSAIKHSDILKYWIFSIHCLYLLQNQQFKYDPTKLKSSFHFPARLRQLLNHDITFYVVNLRGYSISKEEYNSLLSEITSYSEEMFFLTFDIKETSEDTLNSINDSVLNQSNRVHEHWNKLKPLLLEHARSKLAD